VLEQKEEAMNRKLPVVRFIRKLSALAMLVVMTLGYSGSGWANTTPKNTFNILMNYELGMHCTGFEFSYCCVLPPYNSILAQVVKTQQVDPQNQQDGNSQGGFVTGNFFPQLLGGDPNVGRDFLGRPTVLRDTELDSNGHFKKYVLRYWHDAQPRNDGRGAPQITGTSPDGGALISNVEGNSLLMWNTRFDAAATDANNALIYGDFGADVAAVPPNTCTAGQVGNSCAANTDCDTSSGSGDGICDIYGHQRSSPKNDVMLGTGGAVPSDDPTAYNDPEDNYANAWLNHLYIYANLEGTRLCAAGKPTTTTCNVNADCDTSSGAGDGVCGDSREKDKIRLGLRNQNASTAFSTVVPENSGPAFHPVGPGSTPGLNNVLTFSGDSGTVVFTQMKVLENLPIMLTSPRIWEALGLPLDPFEDTINFFGDPGAIDESTLRPYVQMRAQLHNYDPSQPGGIGTAVLVNGKPVIGTGDAPIDIPNCDRCHALPSSVNSPNNANNPANPNNSPDVYRPRTAALVQEEYEFWLAIDDIDTNAGDSDWYPRLKAAAISILSIHDNEHRTDFTLKYPVVTPGEDAVHAAVTRLGHQSVECQRCHADNVIAVVRSAQSRGNLIPPLTEAIHNNHKDLVFDDSNGRSGACQGCHPAHRSDGTMTGYPITADGSNAYASTDNRDAAGGCFVGRDVHSNPGRDAELGVPTSQAHLNAVGQWLRTNVANDTGHDKGIWCTNCHSQLSQEIWAKENMKDLIHGVPGKQSDGTTDAVNIRALPSLGAIASAVGVSLGQAEAWLDPNKNTVPDQADRNNAMAAIWNDEVDYPDANVATIEVNAGGNCNVPPYTTSSGGICVALDADNDPSVRILDFCTTDDCVAAAQAKLNTEGNGSSAVAVPFQAADDARDHWLAPGEPHCADCHQAPYTEQSGNINAFPPFNYPRKASLFRYSRGHQDITCQGCHESTHGLYPVTAPGYVPGSTLAVDETTWEQAAGMNTDGSHGPLKCGACHIANSKGVAVAVNNLKVGKTKVANSFDLAVDFAHKFTDEADPRQNVCVSCHTDQSSDVSSTNTQWLQHAATGEVSRDMMDKVEISQLGHVAGDSNPLTTVCTGCHVDKSAKVSCSNLTWKQHLPQGDVAVKVWEAVSTAKAGSTCGF